MGGVVKPARTPLDDTLSRLLAAFPADPTADVLANAARWAAEILLARGWAGGGAGYSIGTYPEDREAAEALLERPLTWPERTALEACIRACLDAAESERREKR